MQVLKQKVELLQITKNEKLIEFIGRVCYKSEDKITDDSYEKFLKMLMNNKHESVIEHTLATFKILTNRAIANEFVRHRLTNISQESTRYVNYTKKVGIRFIVPNRFTHLFDNNMVPVKNQYENDSDGGEYTKYRTWVSICDYLEKSYNMLVTDETTPEEARGVLPLDLSTEIVISANFREWRHILKMRKSPKAHPQMVELANAIHDILIKEIKVIFDNIETI